MERVAFPRVAEQFSKYVQVRLNTDPNPLAEKNRAYQLEIVGQLARPMYAIVDPARPGAPLGQHKLSGSDIEVEVVNLRAFLKRFL